MRWKVILGIGIFVVFSVGQIILLKTQSSKLQDTTHINTKSQTRSSQELHTINTTLIETVDNKDPRAALELLEQKAASSDAIAASCHALAHSIGHEAFNKYKNFGKTMSYQNEICNSGYIHGVIESYFTSSVDIQLVMLSVCNAYKLESFLSWECFHGIGHGIMFYTNNNLPLSLQTCDRYKQKFSWSACVNGVFMENFNTDQKIHYSQYLSKTNPFYPCETEENKYKTDCYIYAPTYYLHLYHTQYDKALNWCLSAESNYQGACTFGVGSQIMKENISNPKSVEKTCMQGTGLQVSQCIAGIVGFYINNFASLEKASQLCESLEDVNKKTCQTVIEQNHKMFST